MVQSTVPLEHGLSSAISEEIQKELDDDLLARILIESGWTSVKFRYSTRQQVIDVIDWCIETLPENQWKRLSGSFIFKNPKDAEWFMLRWL